MIQSLYYAASIPMLDPKVQYFGLLNSCNHNVKKFVQADIDRIKKSIKDSCVVDKANFKFWKRYYE